MKIIDLIFKIVRRVSGIEARALYSQLLEAKAELKDRQLDSAWNVSSKHLVEKSLDMAVFPATRNQFFGEHIAKLSSGIEVGPSYRPTFSKRDGYQTLVIDVQDQLSLITKYGADPNISEDMINSIEPVDLVWDGETPLGEILDDKYAWFVACHVIEHQACLISFLQDIDKVTLKEGKLLLAIPNKDLMFDYYRPVSTIGDVITAKVESKSHNLKARVDELFYTSLLEGQNCWTYDYAKGAKVEKKFPLPRADLKNLQSLLSNIMNKPWESEYVDRHRWVFTPDSFESLISILFQMGLSPWQIESVRAGIDCEFMAVLKKSDLKVLPALKIEQLLALISSAR